MKKVRYYDLQSGLEKWMKEDEELKRIVEEQNLECRDKYWVVVGSKGVVVSIREEGVHWVKESIDDEVAIDLWRKPEKTKDGEIFYSLPSVELTLPIRKVIEDCEYTEHDVKDMVRVFGRRLDMNYGLLLESLKEIGIDLSEYDTDRPSRY